MFVADSGRMEVDTWVRTFSKMAAELPSIDDWTLEFAEELKNSLAEPGWKTHQQTRAFARFHCSKCRRKWASNRVLVFFRMKLGYPGPWKGSVKMYIFWQQCERCKMLCDATFSQQNIQITLENLLREIRKKCYGERVYGIPRDLIAEEPTTGPHRRDLCEACIMGVCPLGPPEVTSLWPVQAVSPVHPPSQENMFQRTILSRVIPQVPSRKFCIVLLGLFMLAVGLYIVADFIYFVWLQYKKELWLLFWFSEPEFNWGNFLEMLKWLRYKMESGISEPENNWQNFVETLKWYKYKIESEKRSEFSNPEFPWETFVEMLKKYFKSNETLMGLRG